MDKKVITYKPNLFDRFAGFFIGCGVGVAFVVAILIAISSMFSAFEGEEKVTWFPYFYQGKYYKMDRVCIGKEGTGCFLAPYGHDPYSFQGESWFGDFEYFDINEMMKFTVEELEEKGYSKKEIVEEYLDNL